MYSYFAKNMLLPLSDIILDTTVSKNLNSLERTQWWKPENLEDFQNKKLKELINHSYHNVPYYHDLFKSLSLHPDDIKSTEDLIKLPVLTKQDIRRSPEKFLAINTNTKNTLKMITSGSSGEPFEFFVDKNSLSIFRAILFRGWGFAGYNVGDKIATIAGSSVLPKKMSPSKKLIYLANRDIPLSSYGMNNEQVSKYVTRLVKFNPKYIFGYPSSIKIVADYINKKDIKKINPYAVMTTAETLTKNTRDSISEAFNCDVFDQCGCNDGGESLCECSKHEGYHIGVERSVHEFINDEDETVANNEIGHVVLTELWNYSMPVIRYDAGDMAMPTDELCSCGRGLPLVKKIFGRTVEQIVLPNGNLLPGLVFTDILEKIEGISNYQIIQEKVDKFTVIIVKNNKFCEESVHDIHTFFEGHMGIPLDIIIRPLNEIPKTSAGKRRIVLSKVKV
jgi:phenylacetate-CoA ligase